MSTTSSSVTDLTDLAKGGRIVQLGQILDQGIMRNAPVPDFEQHLYGWHDLEKGEMPGAIEGVTGASDTISMSTHSGTHMDSLSHIAYQGKLFDGSPVDADDVQSTDRGVRLRTRENFTPIVTRGVLYDFPKLLGVERLPQDYVIRLPELEWAIEQTGTDFGKGDVVLFRTGWDTLIGDLDEYVRMPIPGPELDVAKVMVERGVVASGSDTMPFEAAPGDLPLAVHVELIPKNGVHIFEMMDLRDLSASGATEFLFIAAPLRLAGGTGSPINPLAVVS